MKYVWVSMDYATFGLGIEDGVVVEAPPIAKWTVGKDEKVVAAFYRKKSGYRAVTLPNTPPAKVEVIQDSE